MWIHGVGFRNRIKCNRLKNVIFSAISIILAIIFDGNVLLYVYHIFINAKPGEHILQSAAVSATNYLVNIYLRILLYKRREKMKSITHHLSNIYDKLSGENTVEFQMKLFLCLLLSDIVTISYSFVLSSGDGILLGYKGDDFYYAIFSPPSSTYCFYTSVILAQWNTINAAVAGYFCTLCFVLRETLMKLKDFHYEQNTLDLNFRIYHELTDLIYGINELLHPILLTTFILVLGVVFLDAYAVIFIGTESKYLQLFRVIMMAITFARFILICTFSTSVTRAVIAVKKTFRFIPEKLISLEILSTLMHANDSPITFKILNSITIDSSLILTTIGIFLTYGMLLATFTITY